MDREGAGQGWNGGRRPQTPAPASRIRRQSLPGAGFPSARRSAAIAILFLALIPSAASAQEDPFADPFRAINQPIHGFNIGADQRMWRPVTVLYRETVPMPIRNGLHNVFSNLALPTDFLNHLLQGNVESAGRTAIRFGFNTLFGVGGIHDLATAEGLPRVQTDFGLTLAYYGIGEGGYLTVPLIGPTTLRDLTGFAVDIYAGPTQLGDADILATVGYTAFRAVDLRDRRFTTIDQLLYETGDSYTSLRNAFLQNRRFQASGNITDPDDLPDLYDDYDDEETDP